MRIGLSLVSRLSVLCAFVLVFPMVSCKRHTDDSEEYFQTESAGDDAVDEEDTDEGDGGSGEEFNIMEHRPLLTALGSIQPELPDDSEEPENYRNKTNDHKVNMKATTDGGVSALQIQTEIRSKQAGVYKCLSTAGEKYTIYDYRVRFGWTINRNGTVSDVKLVDTNSPDEELEECITDKIERMSFNSKPEPVYVEYGWNKGGAKQGDIRQEEIGDLPELPQNILDDLNKTARFDDGVNVTVKPLWLKTERRNGRQPILMELSHHTDALLQCALDLPHPTRSNADLQLPRDIIEKANASDLRMRWRIENGKTVSCKITSWSGGRGQDLRKCVEKEVCHIEYPYFEKSALSVNDFELRFYYSNLRDVYE